MRLTPPFLALAALYLTSCFADEAQAAQDEVKMHKRQFGMMPMLGGMGGMGGGNIGGQILQAFTSPQAMELEGTIVKALTTPQAMAFEGKVLDGIFDLLKGPPKAGDAPSKSSAGTASSATPAGAAAPPSSGGTSATGSDSSPPSSMGASSSSGDPSGSSSNTSNTVPGTSSPADGSSNSSSDASSAASGDASASSSTPSSVSDASGASSGRSNAGGTSSSVDGGSSALPSDVTSAMGAFPNASSGTTGSVGSASTTGGDTPSSGSKMASAGGAASGSSSDTSSSPSDASTSVPAAGMDKTPARKRKRSQLMMMPSMGSLGGGGMPSMSSLMSGFSSPLSSLSSASSSSGASSSGGCPPLYLIFARGTFEIQGTFGLVGKPLCSALQSLVPGTLCYDTVYTSDAEYLISPGIGAQTASAFMSSVASRCPKTKFALAGYSKGAMVVHKITGQNVVGAATFGDPLKFEPVKSTTVWKTYCHLGDPVCLNGFNVMAHLTYGMENIPDASNFLYNAYKDACAKGSDSGSGSGSGSNATDSSSATGGSSASSAGTMQSPMSSLLSGSGGLGMLKRHKQQRLSRRWHRHHWPADQ